MNSQNDYIAVFDSGVGGISVLRQLRKEMPRERFYYFGDSANAPYGTRSTAEIRDLTLAAAEKLMAKGIKALVIACNTATSAAITALREKYPDTIVVGIEPALKSAAKAHPGGTVGVMATPATLRQTKFAHLMELFATECTVVKLPAVGLVERIEAGEADSPETASLLHDLLAPYAGKLDGLVLGCTHYPFAARAISAILGDKTQLFDGGVGTAQHTRRRLEAAGLLRQGEGEVIIEDSDPAKAALCRALLEAEL